MKEIEVKILDIDRKKVLSQLKKLKAKLVFDGEVVALYYDFPDKRLRRERKIFRLRKKGDQTELVLKRMRSQKGAKIMDEFEVLVTDFSTARRIFDSLGMKVVRQVKKHRTSFILGATHFEIDTLSGVPAWLEIESPSLGKLKATVAQLGYAMSETTSWTCFQVLEYYRKKRNQN